MLVNFTHLADRSGTSVFFHHHLMDKVRTRLNISTRDIYKNITVDDDLVVRFGMALIGRIKGTELSTKIIEDALNHGVFLTFNHMSSNLQESKLHIALKQILKDIQSLRSLDGSNAPEDWGTRIVSAISAYQYKTSNAVVIAGIDLAYALSYYDRIENIFHGHLTFCRVLLGLDDDIQSYNRQPLTVFGDVEEHQLRKEKVSEAEISHLIQNNIWPLGTKVPRDVFGASDEEQIKSAAEYITSILYKSGIDPNQFKDSIDKVAQSFLDQTTAGPTEGIENLDTI